MKPKANNPRQITKKRLDKLAETLTRLGDLSGIVHNEQTDNIVGGNQRSRVISIADCEIEIVHSFASPDEQGTTALGYALWRGKRYVYRRVSWPQVTEDEACIVANHAGGIDDMDKLANEWDVSSVLEWAGMDVQAWQDEKRVVAGWGEMLAAKTVSDEFSFDGLPTEDRAPFRQVTFTLHDSQFEQVSIAIKSSKDIGPFTDSPNENSNGNALARICETFLTEHGDR